MRKLCISSLNIFAARIAHPDHIASGQISKDDFLPKKICERCVTRLEQLYEWRQSCLSTDSVLRNYAESMRIVTSTINFQEYIAYSMMSKIDTHLEVAPD
ncbi:hypothetical protein EVAR_14811_1 [Eumeta japonica]|uniref:ZAD domain-containing protein n=1 Tax=Eumeta variegata TaxID=151549 RepID=A0A4C1TXS1_EUMVA|nr:hypothetical protein EVAR_14811_1 [Eumeta japonica]